MSKSPNLGKESPLISIITVSAFEHERLKRTLDSFVKLDLSFEIVLVIPEIDDISNQEIQAYKDRFIGKITVLYDNNEGIYVAMNLGIFMSTGRFCMFLNAGDEVMDSVDIEDFTLEIGKVKEHWAIFHPTLSWSTNHIERNEQISDFFTLDSGTFISHQAVLFQTEMLREIGGYDTRYKVIGDTALMYQFFSRGKPYMSKFNFSKVEAPKFASIYQRKSRIEFLWLILFTYRWDIKLIAVSKFLKREVQFLFRRLCAAK